jgi:glucose dehydrogenase
MNLLYRGTGNPTPVLNGAVRPGDDLDTCSIVALNPDTGKLVWSFQPSPHDTHDWDASEITGLVDGVFHGKPRKILWRASRNGYFFVLDRATGESLLTIPFGATNWALGIDKKGQPILNPDKDPAPDGRLVALTTGSGLTFTGDATGNMLALDTATGKTLWHAGLGAGIDTSPTTYELDGRQYVLVGAGQTLFAWALPVATFEA